MQEVCKYNNVFRLLGFTLEKFKKSGNFHERMLGSKRKMILRNMAEKECLNVYEANRKDPDKWIPGAWN